MVNALVIGWRFLLLFLFDESDGGWTLFQPIIKQPYRKAQNRIQATAPDKGSGKHKTSDNLNRITKTRLIAGFCFYASRMLFCNCLVIESCFSSCFAPEKGLSFVPI